MFKLISAIQDFVRRHQTPATAIAKDVKGLLLQARAVLIEMRGRPVDGDDGDAADQTGKTATVSLTFGKGKRSAADQARGGQS